MLSFIKMKQDIEKIVEIPEGIEATIENNKITIKSGEKEITKEFNLYKINLEKKDNKIIISSKNATKREAKMIGTIQAHIKNMIKGMKEDFVYKLEICNIHFPMNVKVEGDKIIISSFLGETKERIAKIFNNAKVEIKGNEIIVSSFDKEAAGQTAANIEKATKVKGRDRRIFQDGIFITEKPGREI